MKLLDYIWRGDHYLSAGYGNSLGRNSLVSQSLKIIEAISLKNRPKVLVICKNNGNKAEYIARNVYSHNQLNENKICQLLELIEDWKLKYECDNVIIGGDFNIVLMKQR